MSPVHSTASTTYGILHTSVKTDQLSSNRCQEGRPHCHGPAHSSPWCVTVEVCAVWLCMFVTGQSCWLLHSPLVPAGERHLGTRALSSLLQHSLSLLCLTSPWLLSLLHPLSSSWFVSSLPSCLTALIWFHRFWIKLCHVFIFLSRLLAKVFLPSTAHSLPPSLS